MSAVLEAVLAQHRLITHTQCGAISIPLVHHHGAETDTNPGPLRSMRCTKGAGHGEVSDHEDAICCYRFQTFKDWQVVYRRPRTFDKCSCGQGWPCPTIKAMQEAQS